MSNNKFCDHRTTMKYFFSAILLSYFVAALGNPNLTAKPANNENETKKASQCNVNNNNYNSFFAGPNSKKIENMFSEMKQQLAEIKQEISEMKGNQTGGTGKKAGNGTTKASQCYVNNYNSFFVERNHTKKIEIMVSEVKQQLTELKEGLREMKENQTGGRVGIADNSTMKTSQCNAVNNCDSFYARQNHTNNIEKMFSEVKQHLAELKQEIKQKCGKVYKNCAHVYKSGEVVSGVYNIDPDGLGTFEVFCDQKTAGGGWTVFQKRRDGSVDFFRAWDDYKRGFGNLNGEFWLGLDKIHRLTVSSSNKLRVDLERFNNDTAFAEYSSFSVANETAKYQLNLGSYSGTAGDSLDHHRGSAFSTKDRDNDANVRQHCAMDWKGAWWYYHCQYSNLNGLYLHGESSLKGVRWYHWKGDESLKRSEMKIRPKDF